jgi:hypothetical protein
MTFAVGLYVPLSGGENACVCGGEENYYIRYVCAAMGLMDEYGTVGQYNYQVSY